jgi:thiol:disulfide interchange protein DsbC
MKLFKISHLIRTVALLSCFALGATHALAQTANPQQEVKNRLAQLGIKDIVSIQPAPVKGLYEVVADKKVFYSDAGNYLIMGDMLDIAKKQNLTQKRREALANVSIMGLPLNQTISWKRGNPTPEQTIVVFSDPNCGHCKSFANELQKVPNIQVYEFIIPILGSDSASKAKQILCQPKNGQLTAWHNWMNKGKLPNTVNCTSADALIKNNLMLAEKLDITGTPTILFKNGSRIAGSLTAQELQDEMKKRK